MFWQMAQSMVTTCGIFLLPYGVTKGGNQDNSFTTEERLPTQNDIEPHFPTNLGEKNAHNQKNGQHFDTSIRFFSSKFCHWANESP
jgi:hypothetical protein